MCSCTREKNENKGLWSSTSIGADKATYFLYFSDIIPFILTEVLRATRFIPDQATALTLLRGNLVVYSNSIFVQGFKIERTFWKVKVHYITLLYNDSEDLTTP